MTRPRRPELVVLVALVPLMLSAPTRADKGVSFRIARHYEVHLVGPSGEIATSSAADIDNNGRVVGTWVDTSGAAHGFLVVPGLDPVELNTPTGAAVTPARINTRGQIIGTAAGADGTSHGVLFTPGNGWTDLNELLGIPVVSVRGLNDAGQLTGAILPPEPGARRIGFLFTPGLDVVYLTSPERGSEGVAVNESGVVAVDVGRPPQAPYLFMIEGGLVEQDLPGGWGNGAVTDINDDSQFVGYGSIRLNGSFGDTHAHKYIPGDHAIDLGTLGGSTSTALGINNQGLIVGQSLLANSPSNHAFLYVPGVGMLDLNDLIAPSSNWELTSAVALNDACTRGRGSFGRPLQSPSDRKVGRATCGRITGTGLYRGQVRAFVLIPSWSSWDD
jgi:probable HAF family extracellular repeat protein